MLVAAVALVLPFGWRPAPAPSASNVITGPPAQRESVLPGPPDQRIGSEVITKGNGELDVCGVGRSEISRGGQ